MNNFVTYPLPQMNKTLNETEKNEQFCDIPINPNEENIEWN
jgi:hypothetical protein